MFPDVSLRLGDAPMFSRYDITLVEPFMAACIRGVRPTRSVEQKMPVKLQCYTLVKQMMETAATNHETLVTKKKST